MVEPSCIVIGAQVSCSFASNANLTFTVYAKNLGRVVICGEPVASQYAAAYSVTPPLTWSMRVDYRFWSPCRAVARRRNGFRNSRRL